jgi:hypothetical protein
LNWKKKFLPWSCDDRLSGDMVVIICLFVVVLGTGIQKSVYEFLLSFGGEFIGVSDLIADGTDIVESLTTVPESKLDLFDEILLIFCGSGGVAGFERIAICGDPIGYVAEAGAEDFLGLYISKSFHCTQFVFFFHSKEKLTLCFVFFYL